MEAPLAEEFPAARGFADASPPRLDGVIVLSGEQLRVTATDLDVAGRDIIVVQVKRGRLGMNLMRQALFSRELMKGFMPASIRTVALCERDDTVLRPLAEEYGIEVQADDKDGAVRLPARVVAGSVVALAVLRSQSARSPCRQGIRRARRGTDGECDSRG